MTPPTMHSPSPLREISWRLVLLLGTLALVRPLLSITGLADTWGRPATPLLATLAISLVWISAVVATRARRPVLTLVVTGVVYAVLSIVLSGVLSVALEGELQGPLANPVAIIGILVTNAVWGAVTGVVASLALRSRRD